MVKVTEPGIYLSIGWQEEPFKITKNDAGRLYFE